MAESELNPWQVMARRPAPLAKLVESENERLLAARTPASAAPPKPDAPRPVSAVQPAPTSDTSEGDELA